MTISGHFFANHMVIFHKTEIQTVILRCFMSQNFNWYKSYDTNRKNSKNANLCFWTKLQKNGNGNISILCYNLWSNQNLAKFRPVKHVKITVWTSVLWKIDIHIAKKMARNGRNMVIYKGTFVSNHSLVSSWIISQSVQNKQEALPCPISFEFKQNDNWTDDNIQSFELPY